ncbi:MAG TPA: hypothetical protein VF329_07995 [Gammaproteobacteria bacterium]
MRLLFCLSLALVAAIVSADDVVYRSISPDGTVVYSDRPLEAGATPVLVVTSHAGVVHTAPPPPPVPARPAEAQPAEDAGQASQTESARPEPTAEERAQNCAVARERVERYATAHRLYRTLPSGEREYLNDAEIDEARARAAADVETWCG